MRDLYLEEMPGHGLATGERARGEEDAAEFLHDHGLILSFRLRLLTTPGFLMWQCDSIILSLSGKFSPENPALRDGILLSLAITFPTYF